MNQHIAVVSHLGSGLHLDSFDSKLHNNEKDKRVAVLFCNILRIRYVKCIALNQ